MRRIVVLTMFGAAYVVGRVANVWQNANPVWKYGAAFAALTAFNVVVLVTR